VTSVLAFCNILRHTVPTADLWDAEGRLLIDARVRIPAHELTVRATRAGGPGGQHVNTSSTRVEVVWALRQSGVLDDAQRARLEERLASRLDSRGALRVVAADTRSQAQNRALALSRLAEIVRAALVVPKVRRKTKPTKGSKEARLEGKKRRSSTKRDRRWRGDD
jgi:ribosome-associated protein